MSVTKTSELNATTERKEHSPLCSGDLLAGKPTTLYLMVARAYETCNRCRKHSKKIVDDGHGRGICPQCDSELEMRRDLRHNAMMYPKCHECGKTKPRKYFGSYQLQRWDSLRTDKMQFGKRVVYTPEITCQTCELARHQKAVAKSAENDLRTKSVRWWKRGTRLTEKQLPEELIETKTIETKVRNLWQSPQI